MSRCRHATSTDFRPVTRTSLVEEPFRIFFPWSAFLGLAGVMLWPLFIAGWLKLPPGLAHSRLMILGFGGGCVIGFLGTAAPRMLGTYPLRPWETLGLWLCHAAAAIACASLHDETGCLLFAAAFLALPLCLLRRVGVRADVPPPGFVLVLLGLLCGAAGCLLFAFHVDWQNAFAFRLVRLLVNEGFLLLPILGVSGFLAPRILNLPCRHAFPDSRVPPAGWWPVALEALAAGLLILLSLAIEASGSVSWGAGLRFLFILGWWLRDMPGLWRATTVGTQAWMLKMGLGFVTAAPLLLALDPLRLIAMEHVLFITGFGLTIYAVGARVVFGHSGQLAEARGVSKPLRWLAWLAILAMSTRVSADYVASIQNSHYFYAALTWVILTVIWLRVVWRGLWTADIS